MGKIAININKLTIDKCDLLVDSLITINDRKNAYTYRNLQI